MTQRTRKPNRLVILAVVALLLSSALPLLILAQSGLSLRWSNISSGYGISSGGNYAIAGTSGEMDGASLTGDGYQVTGGFWSGVEEPPPVGPTPQPAQYRLYLPSTIR
jgi:hypothetical protein